MQLASDTLKAGLGPLVDSDAWGSLLGMAGLSNATPSLQPAQFQEPIRGFPDARRGADRGKRGSHSQKLITLVSVNEISAPLLLGWRAISNRECRFVFLPRRPEMFVFCAYCFAVLLGSLEGKEKSMTRRRPKTHNGRDELFSQKRTADAPFSAPAMRGCLRHF